MNEKVEKLIAELREEFEKMSDTERTLVVDELMEGYCPTCASKITGRRCWGCYDSPIEND